MSLFAYAPAAIPPVEAEGYDKAVMKVIVENTLAQPDEWFEFTVTGSQINLRGGGARKYKVAHTGRELRVSHSSEHYRFFNFHFCHLPPSIIEQKLNSCLLEYVTQLKEDHVVERSQYHVHHGNVMSIDVIPKYVDTRRPLIIFDVDNTLITPHVHDLEGDNSVVKPVEAATLPQQVIDKIRMETPEAKFLMISNAYNTQYKLHLAGVEVEKGIPILELMSPEEYMGESNKSDYETYVRVACDKGKALRKHFDEFGVYCDCVHFIDDSLSNLEAVLAETLNRELRCHTYDFIRTAGRTSRLNALPYGSVSNFFQCKPYYVRRLATKNFLFAERLKFRP